MSKMPFIKKIVKKQKRKIIIINYSNLNFILKIYNAKIIYIITSYHIFYWEKNLKY